MTDDTICGTLDTELSSSTVSEPGSPWQTFMQRVLSAMPERSTTPSSSQNNTSGMDADEAE